jgi:hypothetical protein
VPVRDAEALTAAIRMYLRDPTLRQQHGANARHRALCEFDPRIMREALLQEYVRLLGERGRDELGGHLDWGRRPHAGGDPRRSVAGRLREYQ